MSWDGVSARREDRVLACVHEVLDDYNAELPAGLKVPKAPRTLLFGADGHLDSLALVRLIVDLEEKVEARLGMTVTLVNERAMSEQRSPFATVGSLTAYLRELIAETGVVV